jgi:peptidoglycan/xylan/chitin deacetylase (PgdA/CDA1 family)
MLPASLKFEMRVAISFDYDSPAGYRESFGKASLHDAADLEGTDALLKVLAKHDVSATFAIVGNAALPGPAPEHAPDQVRAIRDAGHEIASHSMLHRFIPPMQSDELIEDLRASKKALETCTGQVVRGFVPPFNRPFHFPQKGTISISEMAGLHKRGRGRQSVDSVLRALEATGFGWCRVTFQPMIRKIMRRFGYPRASFPTQPFLWRGVVAMPLHVTGFGNTAESLFRQYIDTDSLITLCGHPFQALDSQRAENNEHVDALDRLLTTFQDERRSGKLRYCTMADAETAVRNPAGNIVPSLSEVRDL